MASIDMASIEKKILDYAKSPKGQKRMDKTLTKYVNQNVDITDAGSEVVNKKKMKNAAKELIKLVKKAAASSDVAESVLADISTLTASEPRHIGGTTWEIELSFGGDLGRASLQPNKYGGVTNIIALFNNGYPADGGRSEAIAHVRGFWHGEYISARPYREPLQFMQNAANEFNAIYGAKYNAYVTLDGIYQG